MNEFKLIEHNLTNDNYFSKEAEAKFFGSSSIKAYDMTNESFDIFNGTIEGGCEAREIAIKNGEWEKPEKKAFLVGNYVHSAMDSKEAFQKFCDDNYSFIFKKNGSLYSDFEKADKMIERLKKSEIVKDMQNCDHEVIMVGEIAGVKIKIMCDLLSLERGYIADYKTTQKINKVSWKNGKKVSFIDMFNYKDQVAIYSEIIRQNTGRWLDFYFIPVSKEDTPDLKVIFMTNGNDENSFIHERLENIELKLPHMYLVKTGQIKPKRCESCAYCRSTAKILKPISLEEFEMELGL